MKLDIEVTARGTVQLKTEATAGLSMCPERAESLGHMIIAAAENARCVRDTRAEMRLEALYQERDAIEAEIAQLVNSLDGQAMDEDLSFTRQAA